MKEATVQQMPAGKIIRTAFRVSLLLLLTGTVACCLTVYLLFPWSEVDNILKAGGDGKEQLVNLDSIPRHLLFSVVMAEDSRFFEHNGVSLTEIKAAITDWIMKGETLRGASTISQQTARILFLSKKRSWLRKVLELFTTIELERRYCKHQILALYLTYSQWGEDIYGLKKASRHYFDKDPGDIEPGEAAILATLLPNPQLMASEYLSGSLSARNIDKLYRVYTRTLVIITGLQSEDKNSAAITFLEDRSITAFLNSTWYEEGMDNESMVGRFNAELHEAIRNFRDSPTLTGKELASLIPALLRANGGRS